MLPDTLSITHNITAVTMTKVSEQNNEASFRGSYDKYKFEMSVSHDLPKSGKSGERHHIKLNTLEFEDSSLVTLVRNSSNWWAMQTYLGTQSIDEAQYAGDALVGIIEGVDTILPNILAGES